MTQTLIQWNSRGYRRNYSDLRAILQEQHPLCVCIQETMLGNLTPTPPQNYNIETFSDSPNPRPGTGLLILVRRDVALLRLPITSQLQAMAVQTNINNKIHTICNFYIPPGHRLTLADAGPARAAVATLPNPRRLQWQAHCNYIIDQIGRTIEHFITNCNICLLNTGETTHLHVQTDTTSAIDLSQCTPDIVNNARWSVMSDTYGSDHFPIHIDFTIHQPLPTEPRYIMKRADWKTFRALTRMPEPELDLPVDEMTRDFTDTIRMAANVAIPRSKGGAVRHRVPWWNDDCARANLDRKRTLRRFQRTGNIADKIAYKRARAIAQYTKDTARKESWKRYVSSLNSETPMSKIWQRIRKIAGRPGLTRPCLRINGAPTTDPQVVATELARYFADISSGQHYPRPFLYLKHQQEQQHLDFRTDHQYSYNDPITYLEIFNALQQSTRNTSPGPDGIHKKVLKKMHPTAITALLAIYNKIWTSHSYLTQWRTATVLAFLKPGKPPSETSSYRPIALTSCVGKIMEKIVNNRLIQHLESQQLISPVQYGFRPLRGTTEALIRLQNHIVNNNTEGKHTICVFFDMQKAYDTTWRHGIMQFIDRNGIRGNMAQFIQEFLRRRSCRVKEDTSLSPLQPQTQGVPQGSVISCTLFLMAINDITTALPPNVQSSLYVDDFMIYASSRYLPTLTRKIQIAINRVNQWTTTHGFSFSNEKTTAIHFKRARSIEQPPQLSLQGRPIIISQTAKFLGMTFDCRLLWKPHVQALKGGCLKRMNLLRHVAGLTWGADRLTLLRLYRATIRSKLDYGCIIYQYANKATLSALDSVHHSAIRICTGAFRTSPVLSLHAESGEPPLYLHRVQLTLQMIARLKQLPQSPTWRSVITEDQPNNFPYNIPSSEDYETLLATTQAHTNGAVGCAAAAGAAVVSRRLSSSSSIFAAELVGVSCALSLIDQLPGDDFTIFVDSKSMVQALRAYNSRHPIVREILTGLLRLAGTGRAVSVCWVPGHVGVRGNERADEAAVNAASSDQAIHSDQVPSRDHYPIIKASIRHI
ncbi:uncharacterized protein LOC108676647 [Hyalella azteca]|uniref:Uncharacterized protein LOC108676647 n=1 Tax=Hyalella azteca TaxID=294128 RepID=A0A8B7P2K6_HYAAZ|nr:uncharacterized protein LOC108676647 [Hyalella azteca]